MVSCCSCQRIITTGTIRCSNCSSAYHLSCSHSHKITSEGVFNFCCGNEPMFPGAGSGYQMRTRRNKRKQNVALNLGNSFGSNNSFGNNRLAQQNQQYQQQQSQYQQRQNTGSMRYGKQLKIDTTKMVFHEKPVLIEEQQEEDCSQVDDQQDYADDEILNQYDSADVEVQSNESITILDNDNDEPQEIQSQVQSSNTPANDNNSITLETVWEGISGLQSSISNISNSLDTVSNHLNTFDPRINDLETTLNTIKVKTSNLENVQNDVSGLKEELTRISNELENIKTTQSEKSIDMSTILIEVKEREIKSKNILIYNVPEDNLRISQDYSTLDDINKFNALVAARDTSRAREILENVPNVDLDEIYTRRLGRIRANYCRPLRVTLQNKEDVITIMKNKALINKQYSVKTDLTKMQQRKIKELKEELDTINVDKLNPTMTIKFVSGEPQIIPIGGYFKRE